MRFFLQVQHYFVDCSMPVFDFYLLIDFWRGFMTFRFCKSSLDCWLICTAWSAVSQVEDGGVLHYVCVYVCLPSIFSLAAVETRVMKSDAHNLSVRWSQTPVFRLIHQHTFCTDQITFCTGEDIGKRTPSCRICRWVKSLFLCMLRTFLVLYEFNYSFEWAILPGTLFRCFSHN